MADLTDLFNVVSDEVDADFGIVADVFYEFAALGIIDQDELEELLDELEETGD